MRSFYPESARQFSDPEDPQASIQSAGTGTPEPSEFGHLLRVDPADIVPGQAKPRFLRGLSLLDRYGEPPNFYLRTYSLVI